jgi:glycosyltransferase involved in cell wall biosynthesis
MSSSHLDVSVIIPSHNRRQFTVEAIESAIGQKDVEVEIIVVDDGSTDDTCKWIQKHYPQVRLFQKLHKGAGSARNHGLKAATGRYIKFLDSDDLLAQDSLKKQVEFLNQCEADICYGDWEFFGNLDSPEVGNNPLRIMGQPDDIIVALLGSWWGPPSMYLIRSEFLHNHHVLWDETLKRNQDMDFFLKIAIAAGVFSYIPGVVTKKRVHDLDMIMKSGDDIYGKHCEIIADTSLRLLRECNGLTEERKQAVADLYWHSSRLLKDVSRDDYSRVIDKIGRLYTRYIPKCTTYASPKMRLAVRFLGVRGAESFYETAMRFMPSRGKKHSQTRRIGR